MWRALGQFLERAVKDFGPVVGLAIIGWLGERGDDGGFIKDIWTALKTASPPVAMILLVLLLREQRERKEAQKQCNERTVDFVNATNGMARSQERTQLKFAALLSQPKPTTRRRRR